MQSNAPDAKEEAKKEWEVRSALEYYFFMQFFNFIKKASSLRAGISTAENIVPGVLHMENARFFG